MSYISEVIENIKENGNCQIYYTMTDNPRLNYVREFRVDNNGELCYYGRIEVYDTPFWNGKEFDKTATKELCDVFDEQSYEDMCISIAQIALESVNSNGIIGITTDKKEHSQNTTKAVCKLYSIADSMLELKNSQLTKIRLTNVPGQENILLSNISKYINEDLDPRMASILIEAKVAQLKARYKKICLLWSDLGSFKSTESEEYRTKEEQWRRYYSDETTSNAYIKY